MNWKLAVRNFGCGYLLCLMALGGHVHFESTQGPTFSPQQRQAVTATLYLGDSIPRAVVTWDLTRPSTST
jgi:hypothetical protein